MNLLLVSDLHGVGFLELEESLNRLSSLIDLVCTLGDIHINLLKVLKERLVGIPIIGVVGNHDSSYTLEAAEVTNLHLSPFFYKDFNFIGLEGSHRYSNKNAPMYTQYEALTFVGSISKDIPIDVLICHNSPRGIHDREDSAHIGFEAITELIEKRNPSFVFHGHQHKNLISRHQETLIVGVYGGIVFNTCSQTVIEQLPLEGFFVPDHTRDNSTELSTTIEDPNNNLPISHFKKHFLNLFRRR